MVGDPLSIPRFLLHKIRYPKSKLSLGAYVDKRSDLNDGVKIAPGVKVFRSELGPGVIIMENCIVKESTFERHNRLYRECWLWKVQMGAYSYIAPRAEVSMTTIGRFCSIGPRFQCSIGDHPAEFISTSPIFFSTLKQCGISFAEQELFTERNEITIGNDVWIGASVFVKDGIKIGDGAIIAAGAVIVNNVPDYAIVGGVPAKLIRYRFSDNEITALLKIQWWNWPENKLRKAQAYFAQKNISAFIEWATSAGEL